MLLLSYVYCAIMGSIFVFVIAQYLYRVIVVHRAVLVARTCTVVLHYSCTTTTAAAAANARDYMQS